MRTMKKSLFLVVLSLLSVLASASVPQAHAQTSGVVCIADPTSTSCPSSPIVLSGVSGTQISVAVNVQASSAFNGFEIFVKADVSVLRAVSVDLSNSVLGSNVFTATDCIDFGPGCMTAQNGVGIVQVGMVALGSSTTAPTTGRLFSIKYNVTQTAQNMKVGFQTGCANTSTSPNFCVTVVYGGTVVPETLQESTGVWGNFAMLFSPTLLTLSRLQYSFALLTVSSVDGFFGSVSLSISLSPMRGAAPKAQFVAFSEIFLLPGTSTFELVSVITFRTTPPGDYVVTVAGIAGTLSHTVQLAVEVTH